MLTYHYIFEKCEISDKITKLWAVLKLSTRPSVFTWQYKEKEWAGRTRGEKDRKKSSSQSSFSLSLLTSLSSVSHLSHSWHTGRFCWSRGTNRQLKTRPTNNHAAQYLKCMWTLGSYDCLILLWPPLNNYLRNSQKTFLSTKFTKLFQFSNIRVRGGELWILRSCQRSSTRWMSGHHDGFKASP